MFIYFKSQSVPEGELLPNLPTGPGSTVLDSYVFCLEGLQAPEQPQRTTASLRLPAGDLGIGNWCAGRENRIKQMLWFSSAFPVSLSGILAQGRSSRQY